MAMVLIMIVMIVMIMIVMMITLTENKAFSGTDSEVRINMMADNSKIFYLCLMTRDTRELKQRGRERQRERYKKYTYYRIQSLSHGNATTWPLSGRRL